MVVISLTKCKYEEKQSRKRSVKELIIIYIHINIICLYYAYLS